MSLQSRMEVIARHIRRLVSSKLGVREDQLAPHDNLASDLGADSLDVVELVMAIEREFQIRIPDEVFPELQTLADVTRYVAGRRAVTN